MRTVAACLLLMLSACGGRDAPAATPLPADPQLTKLYEQTCMACHGRAGTGAPVAGDRAAWEPRVAQGMKVLVDHTVAGYKGMPPLGACMDCSEADFERLIHFMAGLNAS